MLVCAKRVLTAKRVIWQENGGLKPLIAVDLTTGIRSEFSAPFPWAFALTADEEDQIVYVASSIPDEVWEFDLATGATIKTLTSPTIPDSSDFLGGGSSASAVWGLVLDRSTNPYRLLATNAANNVVAVDTQTGQQSIFSSASIPNNAYPIDHPQGIALDSSGSRVFVVGGDFNPAVHIVSLLDGSRTLLSSNATPNNELPFSENADASLLSVAYDSERGRLLVVDLLASTIFAVDSETGIRSIFTSTTYPDTDNQFLAFMTVFQDERIPFILATDLSGALLAIDAESGRRVFISKN